MRLTAAAGALRDAIDRARTVTPTTPKTAAHAAVRLHVTGGRLVITGSDGDTTIDTTCAARDLADGDALIPPRPLSAWLATLPADDPVNLVATAGELEVRSTTSDPYRLRLLGEVWPTAETVTVRLTSVAWSQMQAAVTVCRAAAGRELPHLQLSSDDRGDLLVRATDNYRLTQARLRGGALASFTGVVPLVTAERIARLSPVSAAHQPGSRLLAVGNGATRLTCRLAAHPFPAVETLLAELPAVGATIEVATTRTSLKRLSAIASPAAPVTVTFAGDRLTLTAGAADVGSGSEQLNRLSGTEAFSTQVVLGNLTDVVNAATGTRLEVRWSGPTQPVMLRQSEPLEVLWVLMPVSR
jgi:DNA polymerase III subunit beta